MKTSGYALREAIGLHVLRRDTSSRAFKGSLKAFPDEKKEKPQDVVEQFLKAERAIAKLQTAQGKYNLLMTVEVSGELMTLSEAIKTIGGVARAEKMWRSAAGPKEDRYSYGDNDTVRDPNQVRAVPTVSISEMVKLATQVGKRSGALRAAIATTNAKEVEIEGLDASLFE